MKTTLKILVALVIALGVGASAIPVAVPAFAQQATVGSGNPNDEGFQLVPCTGVTKKGLNDQVIGKECDFNSLIELANRVITFGLYLTIPFTLAILIYTAYQYLTSNGNPVKLEKAKHMIKYVFYGLICILGSFIIVYTVLDNLLSDDIKNDSQGIWSSYFKK